jgi:hypothetical protein
MTEQILDEFSRLEGICDRCTGRVAGSMRISRETHRNAIAELDRLAEECAQ